MVILKSQLTITEVESLINRANALNMDGVRFFSYYGDSNDGWKFCAKKKVHADDNIAIDKINILQQLGE